MRQPARAEAVLLVGERALRAAHASSSGASGSRRSTLQRDSSAALTAKDGFSVVAPMSDDRAVLDVRQKRVLLRLVEAVDLVDEHDRARGRDGAAAARLGDDLAQLADAPQHRAERHEVRLRRWPR